MLACLESFPARDDDFHIDFISETLVLQLHIGQSVDSDELLRTVQFKTSQFILKLVHDRHSCAYKRLVSQLPVSATISRRSLGLILAVDALTQ
jgi:hypothetical protein